MKKFIKVWLTVCLVLFLISGGCLVGSIALGTTMEDVSLALENGYDTISDHIGLKKGLKFKNEDWKKLWEQGTELKENKTELKKAKNLKIDLYGHMMIVKDTECKTPTIQIEENAKNRVRIIEEDTLTIVTKPMRNSNGEIILKLPENYQFKDVEIALDSGNIQIDTLIMNKIHITADAGNIDVNEALKCYTANLEVDAGSIHAEEIQCIDQLKAKVDVGKMELKKIDSKDIDLSCDVGKISAGLAGGIDSYNIDLNCDVGNIKLGNENYTNTNKNITHKSEATEVRKMYVSCNVGSVEVDD